MNMNNPTQDSAISHLQALQPADLDAGEVFSGAPSGHKVRGFAAPSPFTPVCDANYIFHESSRDLIVWFINPTDPLYVFGPAGSGKTSCIRQLAARLNYPVFEVTGHGRLEFPDLVGHLSVHQGSMRFDYGPLALAMRFGGLFLLNEIDLLDPAMAAGLNSILDGAPLCIPENGGELICPHPMFRFAATANSNGGADETGLYQGIQRQNLAFMDRFTLCRVDYPAPDTEERLLAKTAPKLPAAIRQKMVAFAGEVRRLFMGEEANSYNANSLEITLSTRTLLRWADLTVRYQPLAKQGIAPINYALDRALGFRASRETKALWWAMQQMQALHKPRKIILIITDGHPDSVTIAQDAIRTGLAIGYEIYGIGIGESSGIRQILPASSMTILNLPELASAMFAILSKSLLTTIPA